MGSFISAFSASNSPLDNLELQPLSKARTDRTGRRRYPLNPNGHGTSNLLPSSFRRRLYTTGKTQTQVRAVESPTGANHSANNEPGATDSDGSASDEVSIIA